VALDPSIFVHENALCESEEIGPRTRIGPFAHVMKGAFVGADCELGDHAVVAAGAWLRNRVIVRDNAFIADHVTTEDDVVVGPNVVFTGEAKDDTFLTTRVKRGAILGATSTSYAASRSGSARESKQVAS
jgi:UDP-2-acetamido-3-amino-2,3-dideoxy-glucuronate N-acetyltransferase